MVWLVMASMGILLAGLLFHWSGPDTVRTEGQSFPLEIRHHLLTPPERSFYAILLRALADHALVFPKVQADRVLMPRESLVARDFQKMRDTLRGRFFDFVICHKNDLQVLGVVELNDRSARMTRPSEDEMFAVRACRGAGLKLFQFDARRTYDLQQVRDVFRYPAAASAVTTVTDGARIENDDDLSELTLNGGSEFSLTDADHRTVDVSEDSGDDRSDPSIAELFVEEDELLIGTESDTDNAVVESQSPHACPRCRSVLVEKRARFGAGKGTVFVHCERFPFCGFHFKID
ncbi:MAG: DUF2726 domain-containing protein [Pseudomonadota bacterium]